MSNKEFTGGLFGPRSWEGLERPELPAPAGSVRKRRVLTQWQLVSRTETNRTTDWMDHVAPALDSGLPFTPNADSLIPGVLQSEAEQW